VVRDGGKTSIYDPGSLPDQAYLEVGFNRAQMFDSLRDIDEPGIFQGMSNSGVIIIGQYVQLQAYDRL
jgi:hypothetical protein